VPDKPGQKKHKHDEGDGKKKLYPILGIDADKPDTQDLYCSIRSY
jgi:hypothetical protein